MEAELRKLYYEPKTGFGSPAHLYKNARKAGLVVTMKVVKAFVDKQEVAQLFAPKTTKRETRHFKISARRGVWQIDHTFMKNKKINNNYHAIFVAINIGSRYVYAKAMKNIQEATVIETFNEFAKTIKLKHIKGIVSDKGVEFTSHVVKGWMEENNVHHRILHPTYHYLSNSIVERYNGVLKTKLHKYMKANDTKKWIDALDSIVYNHNHSIHSATKARPKDLLKDPIKELIFRLKTESHNHKLRKDKRFVLSKLKVGSKIRILRKSDKPFDKKVQKYNETVQKIEKFIHGGGLIKVKDKSRLLRPFEVLPIDKGVEKTHL
jgi:transposase InsO family protein